MHLLFIINDPPYGSERPYNALRLANAVARRSEVTKVSVFLMADAVTGARSEQKTPEGYYNIERMLKRLRSVQGDVLLCGTCMDARGLKDTDVVKGARRSTMDELAALTVTADRVLNF